MYPKYLRNVINIIRKSEFKHKKSVRLKGTLVIYGDLAKDLIKDTDIYHMVESGNLNLWNSEYKGYIYTYLQKYQDMKPRYLNLGLFPYYQKCSLEELRDLSKQKRVELENRHELYPWKYKIKLTNINNYYFTEHWKYTIERFDKLSGKFKDKCCCCLQDYSGKDKCLLDLHHKITIRNGGTNSDFNLIRICAACHSLVHYWKEPLLDSLMLYYSEFGLIGCTNIENALDKYDSSYFGRGKMANWYQEFCTKCNFSEAIIYFFKKIEECFKYKLNMGTFNFIDSYFKCQKNYSSDFKIEMNHNLLSNNQLLIDCCVFCIALKTLIDKISYYQNKHNSNFVSVLQTKLNDYKKKFIDILKSNNKEINHTLSELLFIINNPNIFKISSLLSDDPYDVPKNKTANSNYTKSLERRNSLYFTFAKAFFNDLDCYNNLEKIVLDIIPDKNSQYFQFINQCVKQSGIKVKFETIIEEYNELLKKQKQLSEGLDNIELLKL